MRTGALALTALALAACEQSGLSSTPPAGGTGSPFDPNAVLSLAARLDLEKYKATIKGLTQFGDRREGTDRNRAAIDWIEAQLKSYGCATARLSYSFPPPSPPAPTAPVGTKPTGPDVPRAVGGGRPRGTRNTPIPNTDIAKQPDARLRELNAQAPSGSERQEVYCTKTGTLYPGEMYIVAAHMDGRGFGEAANDNGSGTALVMELARIFSMPDVQTERSIRFILWNNEETGLNGARAYVEQRRGLQGKDEPKWLGMIQHDMMLFDHGAPRTDRTVAPEQRAEADINIEFQSNSKFAEQSQALAWAFARANESYASDYPARVANHMTNTDSTPFQDSVAAISIRENERGTEIGSGWDPHWHQPTDLYANFTDKDFRLGLNAAQTTLGAVGELAGVSLKPAP